MRLDILLEGCTYLTPRMSIEQNMDVGIRKGKIVWIGPGLESAEVKERIDGRGKLLLPGFTDAHTHSCQQLLRGRTTDEYPMLWTRFLVPFESSLTPEDVYWSVQLACVEMIKNGTTSWIDAGGVHMDQAAESALQSGMRAALCYSTMDCGNVPASMKRTAEDAVAATDRLYDRYHGAGDGRIRIWYGLRQVMTCSPQMIELTAGRARERGTGIHMHLCEHAGEVSFCLEKYGKRPVGFLEDCGALGENLLAAHCVLLTENDIDLLSKYHVKVVHCPRSNMNNHGIPKTPRMICNGMDVALGTDGAAMGGTSLFDDFKAFRSAMKAEWGAPVFDPRVIPCGKLLEMAAKGGAAALNMGDEIGSIEIGKKADLILMNIDQAHISPTHDLLSTVVISAGGRDVTDSIIDGKVVMKNRKLLTLDEKQIYQECNKRAREIAARSGI